MTRPLLASLLVLTLAQHACAMNASPPRLANPDPASNPPSTARDRAPPADGVIHVRPGDTVNAVARQYVLPPRPINEANPLAPHPLPHVRHRSDRTSDVKGKRVDYQV